MILIEDAKYSCLECIRGHRSSLCRHYMRPLLQVRSKGRPNVAANGNPNHRIAVFAEEIDDANCSSKQTPVVILKATPKQIIDLVNGEVIGPYEEKSATPTPISKLSSTDLVGNESSLSSVRDSLVPTHSLVSTPPKLCCSKKSSNENDLDNAVNSTPSKSSSTTPSTTPRHSCCDSKSHNGVSKAKSSCGCSTNNKKKGTKIFKSKILQKFLKNHLKELEVDKLQQSQQFQLQQLQQRQQLQHHHHQQQHQQGIHHIIKTEDSSSTNYNESLSNIPFHNIHNNGLNPNYNTNHHIDNAFDIVSVSSCSIPGKCSCTTTCSCVGCITHGVESNDSPNYLFDPLLQGNNDPIDQLFTKPHFQAHPVHVMPPQDANFAASTEFLTFVKPEIPTLKQEQSYPNFQQANAFSQMSILDQPQQPQQPQHQQLQQQQQNVHHSYQHQQQFQQSQPQPQSQSQPQPQSQSQSQPQPQPQPQPQHQFLPELLHGTSCPQEKPQTNSIDTQYSSPSYRPLPIQSETSDVGCMCADDHCNCQNCETHGIIDGLKLDEYFFGPNTKLDKRLLDIFDSSYSGV